MTSFAICQHLFRDFFATVVSLSVCAQQRFNLAKRKKFKRTALFLMVKVLFYGTDRLRASRFANKKDLIWPKEKSFWPSKERRFRQTSWKIGVICSKLCYLYFLIPLTNLLIMNLKRDCLMNVPSLLH